jgi:hypothetical protein
VSATLLGLGFKANMGSKTRKLVLLKLIDACKDDGTHIYPSVATVACAAECCKRQVQREIGLMKKVGLLKLVRKGGSRPGDTNEYCLNLDMLHEISKVGWTRYFGSTSGCEDEPVDGMVSPVGNGRSDDDQNILSPVVMGDILRPMGDTSCHPTPPLEPLITHYVRNTLPPAMKNTIRGELLVVLDEEHADAVIDHRKALRRPLTLRAAKVLASKFALMPDPNAAADAMIGNGWHGFEPQWLENRCRPSTLPSSKQLPPKKPTAVDLLRSAIQKYEDLNHETGNGQGNHALNVEFRRSKQFDQQRECENNDRNCRRISDYSGS